MRYMEKSCTYNIRKVRKLAKGCSHSGSSLVLSSLISAGSKKANSNYSGVLILDLRRPTVNLAYFSK